MASVAGLGGQPGLKAVLTDALSGAEVDAFLLSGATALSVAVVDGTGTQITSFGSGGGAASAATLSNVASSATNVTLLASNSSRKGATFVNDSTQTCYVKLGATASSSSYSYLLFASQTLELPTPIYQGQIDAIWVSANGNMRITEIT